MYRAKIVLTHERNWKIIPRNPKYEGWSLAAKISRLASKIVPHFGQDEREAGGVVHRNALKSILTRGLRRDGAEKFTDNSRTLRRRKHCHLSWWITHCWWVTCCCHKGGQMFKIIEDVSSTRSPSWQNVLIPGGNESGRLTVCYLSTQSTGIKMMKKKSIMSIWWQSRQSFTTAVNGHMTKMRAYWVKLGEAQELGLRFWQANSECHHCVWKSAARSHSQDNCQKYQDTRLWEKRSASTCTSRWFSEAKWFNEQQAESISQSTGGIPQTQPCATGSTERPVHD